MEQPGPRSTRRRSLTNFVLLVYAIPFVVVAGLVAAPFPRASVQIGIKGLDPLLLTGPIVRAAAVSGQPLRIAGARGSDAWIDYGRVRGPFKLRISVRVMGDSERSTPFQISLWHPPSRDSFSVWFDAAGRTIWAGSRAGKRVWEFRVPLAKYAINAARTLEIERLPRSGDIRVVIPGTAASYIFTRPRVSRYDVWDVVFSTTTYGGRSAAEVTQIEVALGLPSQEPTVAYVPSGGAKASEGATGWWVTLPVDGIRLRPRNQAVSLIVLTTPTAFEASFRVRIDGEVGFGQPLELGIWDAKSQDTLSIWLSSGGRDIQAGARQGQDHWLFRKSLGRYLVGQAYTFILRVLPGEGGYVGITIPELQVSEVFKGVPVLRHGMLNFSIGASAPSGQSVTQVSEIRITMPDQPYFTYVTTPEFLQSLVKPVTALAAIALITLSIVLFRNGAVRILRVFQSWNKWRLLLTQHRYFLGGVVLIMILQLFLISLGEHPYDMFTMRAWAYISDRYGLRALYPLSTMIPTGQSVKADTSYINAVLAYPPVSASLFSWVGTLFGKISPAFDFNNPVLAYMIKLPWVLAHDVSAIIVYGSTSVLQTSGGIPGVASLQALPLALLYAFNPGINLASATWGQFESLTSLLYVAAVLFALRRRPTAAWISLALAVLTKQTPLVLAPVVTLAIFLTNPPRSALVSLSQALIVVLLILLPWLWVGYTPRFLFNVTLGDNIVNMLSPRPLGVAEWQLTVATGTYNVWPLITRVINGEVGWSRYLTPSSFRVQPLDMTYAQIGAVVVAGSLMLLMLLAVRYRLLVSRGGVFLLMSTFLLTTYTFAVGVHERFLGYLFLPLCLSYESWKNKRLFWLTVMISTVLYAASVYGSLVLTAHWFPGTSQRLAPEAGILNTLALRAVTSDLAITAFSTANLGVLSILLGQLVSIAKRSAVR